VRVSDDRAQALGLQKSHLLNNNKSLVRVEGIAEHGDSGVGINRLFNGDWPVFHLLVSFPPTEPQRSLVIDTHVLYWSE
jgi:hypothetical protein